MRSRSLLESNNSALTTSDIRRNVLINVLSLMLWQLTILHSASPKYTENRMGYLVVKINAMLLEIKVRRAHLLSPKGAKRRR